MPASGPYEVRPRQLRALLLLLVLLPLIPAAFVVRFTVEAIHNERLDARERARHIYQAFLESASVSLAAVLGRELSAGAWALPEPVHVQPAERLADAVLGIAPDGRVVELPGSAAGRGPGESEGLARAIAQSGLTHVALPAAGAVRWRFLCDAPEPLFALRPRAPGAAGSPVPLLIKSRRHLLEMITAYYQRALDAQSDLFVVDENGERTALIGPADAPPGAPLSEVTLPPPLPAWRVQLFSTDEALVDGIARSQIAFYLWSVGGMLAVTLAIAGAAGLALRRRIVLQELGSDALATVSHEIKTPLASIRVFVDTLLEGRVPAGEPAAEYLRLIARENGRIERLVDGFLTLSRLERAGSGEPPATLVSPEELVRSVCSRLRPRFESENAELIVEILPGLPPVRGDSETLSMALVNLLDNALKYSCPPKQIRLQAVAAGGGIEFRVSDRGIGIDPSEHGRIFQRFYQADRRLSRVHDGCGLGLSIVQSVAEAHGGRVSVESAPGRGSTFTLWIPETRSG